MRDKKEQFVILTVIKQFFILCNFTPEASFEVTLAKIECTRYKTTQCIYASPENSFTLYGKICNLCRMYVTSFFAVLYNFSCCDKSKMFSFEVRMTLKRTQWHKNVLEWDQWWMKSWWIMIYLLNTSTKRSRISIEKFKK